MGLAPLAHANHELSSESTVTQLVGLNSQPVASVAEPTGWTAVFAKPEPPVAYREAIWEGLERKVLDLVGECPGISIQELADRVGVSRTATVYHVRKLTKAGTLGTARVGRRVVHFMVARSAEFPGVACGMVRLPTVAPLLSTLIRKPEISWRELARRLSLTVQTIRWHVGRLEKMGLLSVRPTASGGHMVILSDQLLRASIASM